MKKKAKKVWGIWDKRTNQWFDCRTEQFVFNAREDEAALIMGTWNCKEFEIRPCYLPRPLPKKRGGKRKELKDDRI